MGWEGRGRERGGKPGELVASRRKEAHSFSFASKASFDDGKLTRDFFFAWCVEGESEIRDRYGDVPVSEEEEDRGDEDQDDW